MIEKCLNMRNFLIEWNEKRQIRNVCKKNIVSLKKPDGEMVSIYDGSSEGYKSDNNIDIGEMVLREVKNIGSDCDLIISPNTFTIENLNIDEKVLPLRVVSLKLKKH
jgi:hypothetical protein